MSWVAENDVMVARDDIMSLCRSYLEACNRRAWEELKTYLAETILVNGVPRSQEQHVSDVRATLKILPDYQWRLVRAVIEGEWLAVHLLDVGTRSKALPWCARRRLSRANPGIRHVSHRRRPNP